jgi:hypothetical protein
MCESWSRARRSCATRQPVFPCQSSHKTSCNRILEHFLMTNDPRERLSVLKFPFRAVTPKTGRTGLSASRCALSGAFISSTMMVMMMAITPSLNASSRPGDTKIARILYTRNLEIARLAGSQLKPQLIFSRSSKCSIRGKVEIPDYFRSRKAKPATYCSQAIALNELRRLG